MQIEPDQIQQLPVTHLGQIDFALSFDHVVDQCLLGANQGIDTFLDGATTDEFMD